MSQIIMLSVLSFITITLAVYTEVHVEPSRSSKVKQIVDDLEETGTFLRNLGTLSTSSSHYKIIIPFSVDKFGQSFKNIELTIADMMNQYSNNFQKNSWPDSISTGVTEARLLYEIQGSHDRIVSKFLSIRENFNNVADLFDDFQPKRRFDRGLANFIGEGLSFLFGVTSERQLKEAESKILGSQHNQINIVKSEKHLATIINDQQLEIANLQSTQQQLQNHTKNLVYEFKKLIFGEAAQTKEIFKLTIFERLRTFEMKINQELTTLYRKIHKLEDAIARAIRGLLCPNFVTPEILNNILIETSSSLPSHFLLPTITKQKHFFKLYKFLSVDVEILESGHKVFILDIPIIINDDIFQLTLTTVLEVPFVPRLNTTAKVELLNNKVYAINLSTNKGFILDPSELAITKKFQSHFYGSFESWTQANDSQINCILAFQRGAFVKENCSKIIYSHSEKSQFHHLFGDTWGFSVRGSEQLNVSCVYDKKHLNSSKLISLQGFGKVNIPRDCNIYFEDITISAIYTESIEINVAGISSIAVLQAAPANLAFSSIWSDLSNKTNWIISNLTKTQMELENEIGYQIRNTFLHNKTNKLLEKVKTLLNEPIVSTDNVPWYEFNDFSKIDGILITIAVFSLIGNAITFFILKNYMHKIVFDSFRKFTVNV